MSPCHGEDRQFKSDRGRHIFCSGSSVGRAGDWKSPCRRFNSVPEHQKIQYFIHAVVAEWQTRYFEGVVNASSCWFKSSRPHQDWEGSIQKCIEPSLCICDAIILRKLSFLVRNPIYVLVISSVSSQKREIKWKFQNFSEKGNLIF